MHLVSQLNLKSASGLRHVAAEGSGEGEEDGGEVEEDGGEVEGADGEEGGVVGVAVSGLP